ncbi:four helix bundle protein [Maioricimonas sp. JC845]|uniref:four helix bundle protein n=1 Tax=Maioricimonas sp. JC845 TaxID=3232138 RepID=UPI003458E05E
MRDHRQLRAFELADSLVLSVYAATRDFPKDEHFGLRSQIRRSAVSIPSNIVEGCARHSHADYVRFLDVAFASTRELEYQLSLADRLGFIDPDTAGDLAQRTAEVARVLSGLIRALRRRLN